MEIPDENDRHVIQAAVKAKAYLRRLETNSFKRPTHEQKRTKWMSIQMKTATQRGKRDHHG
jgi:hypothetical protein